MTIKDIKEIIKCRMKIAEEKFQEAKEQNNESLAKYYLGKIHMLVTLQHDIALDMTADYIEAMYAVCK